MGTTKTIYVDGEITYRLQDIPVQVPEDFDILEASDEEIETIVRTQLRAVIDGSIIQLEEVEVFEVTEGIAVER